MSWTEILPPFERALSAIRKAGAIAVIGTVVAGGIYIAAEHGPIGGIGGGGGGAGIGANIYVGASGTCTRSATLVSYDASKSCGTHQAAADATLPDDVIGVEPGTYTTVNINYSATCSGTSGHPKVWKPDNGIVRYVGTIGASSDAHAFDLGDDGKQPPGPCSYMTFDGGPDMNFRTGLSTDGTAGSARPGAIHINADYGTPRYATGITLTRWEVCYKCANTASGDGEYAVYSGQHVTMSYSQLGPICCGMTCNPTCETSTTSGNGSPVVYAPQGRDLSQTNAIKGSYVAFVHNTVLGETHLPNQFWPTAALGPAPQGTCAACHTDCAQITVQSHLIIDYNTFYNCQTQILFMDGTGGGWDNGEIIGNLTNTPGGSGGIGWLANGSSPTQFLGNWIVAFNTVNSGTGFAGNSGVGTSTVTYIGNYAPFSFSHNSGNNEGCTAYVAETSGLTVTGSYNVVTNGTDLCGATNVQTCSPTNCGPTALSVQHFADWSASPPDNGVNYHLASSTTVADNLVPQATCASVITLAQSINGSYSWAQAADLDGTPMTGSTCDAGADEK